MLLVDAMRLIAVIPLKLSNAVIRKVDEKLAITAAQREIDMWATVFQKREA